MITVLQPLVLASGSEIRLALLKKIGIEIEARPANVDEESIKKSFRGLGPEALSIKLAESKAAAISIGMPGRFVIGADQVCGAGGKIFDKPGTKENSVGQLLALQGREHLLVSAAAIARNGEVVWRDSEIARMKMRTMSARQAEIFAERFPALESCGAYRYEEGGNILFEAVDGSYECILGLPFHKLARALEEVGAVEFFGNP